MNASQPRNHPARREHDARSLDLVQRVVISVLVAVVFGTFAAVLAAYLAIAGDRDFPPTSVIGLWIMTGVMGLATAAAILLVNRRRPYSPWVLLGLLPMAISAPWVLGSQQLWVNVGFRSLGESRRISVGNGARRVQVEIVPALNSLDIAH